MATEECAICGDSVPFATTTHVLVNPKHVEGVADHYVCRPCYDEHLEGLFAALSADEHTDHDLAVDTRGEADSEGEGDEEGGGDGNNETDANGGTNAGSDGDEDGRAAADGDDRSEEHPEGDASPD